MTIRVHVHGHRGRMGATACRAIEAAGDLELVSRTGRGDDLAAALAAARPQVVVEFTRPDVVRDAVRTCLEAGAHVVSGTTGLPREQARELGDLARDRDLGFLLAPNFAVGVLLMQRFAREAARWFGDVEIVELHHDRKIDAPSGTALDTARQVAAARPQRPARDRGRESVAGARGGFEHGVPIHSVRLPGLVAHQEVLFGGPGQLLTLRHDALDREAFMPGVLLAVRRIASYRGLLESLEPMLADD